MQNNIHTAPLVTHKLGMLFHDRVLSLAGRACMGEEPENEASIISKLELAIVSKST